jgi:DNA ligase-1
LDETSHQFPELERALEKLNCETCILDGEVVGVDKHTGSIVAFQQTSTRRRKHGVADKAEELPVRFYLFDALEKNGRSLIDVPLHQRKEILQKIVGDDTNTFTTAPFIVTSDPKKLHDYHVEQLALGLEGAVIKQYDSVYKSGRKGWRWVKIKEDEGTSGKLSDTLDCIVLGYYRGRGKRAVFGLGAFLVGLLGKDEQILTIAKIGTGLTDEQFRELKQRLDKHEVKTKPTRYAVHKNLIPDVWVDPSLVVEIAADEITRSPVHSAGKALRFPRLIKFRDDKNWQDATTIKELAKIKMG